MTFSESHPAAPAHFAGIQEGFGVFPNFALFTLDEAVGVHPVGSTVSRRTLESHGFSVPPMPGEELVGERPAWM